MWLSPPHLFPEECDKYSFIKKVNRNPSQDSIENKIHILRAPPPHHTNHIAMIWLKHKNRKFKDTTWLKKYDKILKETTKPQCSMWRWGCGFDELWVQNDQRNLAVWILWDNRDSQHLLRSRGRATFGEEGDQSQAHYLKQSRWRTASTTHEKSWNKVQPTAAWHCRPHKAACSGQQAREQNNNGLNAKMALMIRLFLYPQPL